MEMSDSEQDWCVDDVLEASTGGRYSTGWSGLNCPEGGEQLQQLHYISQTYCSCPSVRNTPGQRANMRRRNIMLPPRSRGEGQTIPPETFLFYFNDLIKNMVAYVTQCSCISCVDFRRLIIAIFMLIANILSP